LHKASKTGARVVVYAFKQVNELARAIDERKVHRAEELQLYALDGAFLDGVGATLDRVNRWELSVSGATLYLTIAGKLHEAAVTRIYCGRSGT
jgi:uncharacterized protein YaeQ